MKLFKKKKTLDESLIGLQNSINDSLHKFKKENKEISLNALGQYVVQLFLTYPYLWSGKVEESFRDIMNGEIEFFLQSRRNDIS